MVSNCLSCTEMLLPRRTAVSYTHLDVYKRQALLNVKKGDYLLFVRSTAYDRNGEPVYAGVQVINGDRFALRVYESDEE